MYFKPIVDLRADLKAKLEKAQENQSKSSNSVDPELLEQTKEQLAEKNRIIEKNQSELKKLNSDIKSLSNELKHAREVNERCKKENSDIKTTSNQLQLKLNENQLKINEFDDLKAYVSKLEEKNKAIANENQNLYNIRTDFIKRVEVLTEENKNYQINEKVYLHQIEKLKKDKKKIKKQKDEQQIDKNKNEEQNLFIELLLKIKDLIECPIGSKRIKIPTITPSGVTIDENEMNKIIEKNLQGCMKDPFNPTLECKTKVYNLFAKRVIEFYKEFKRKYKAISKDDEDEIQFLKT